MPTVLVVCPNVHTCIRLSAALRAAGYVAVSAGSADVAAGVLAVILPDAVVADFGDDEERTAALLRVVREQSPGRRTPVVLLSHHPDRVPTQVDTPIDVDAILPRSPLTARRLVEALDACVYC